MRAPRWRGQCAILSCDMLYIADEVQSMPGCKASVADCNIPHGCLESLSTASAGASFSHISSFMNDEETQVVAKQADSSGRQAHATETVHMGIK
jgi:hypothetical protein